MTDQTTHPDALATPWRTGRHVGRTVYAQTGPDATRTDVFIGVMDTPELASAAVDAHNATLAVAPPDQTTPESLTDDDLDAIQQRTDAYGRTGPYGYVINNIEYQGNWVHDIHRLLAEVGRLRAALQVADEIEAERESDPVVLDLRAQLAETRAENARLHTWDGLMSLLDKHWPEAILPTLPDEAARDAGSRIVSLIRWVEMLHTEQKQLRAQLAEIRQAVTEIEQCSTHDAAGHAETDARARHGSAPLTLAQAASALHGWAGDLADGARTDWPAGHPDIIRGIRAAADWLDARAAYEAKVREQQAAAKDALDWLLNHHSVFSEVVDHFWHLEDGETCDCEEASRV